MSEERRYEDYDADAIDAIFSSSLSLKCALRESGCRITFWRSVSRDTNVEVSALADAS